MNHQDFMKRVESETLNAQDLEVLDRELASPSQMHVAQAVRQIPADEPSLVWRSSLNERLDAVAGTQKRRSAILAWLRPTVGLACAGLLAWVGIAQLSPVHLGSAPSTAIEAALISEHATVVEARLTAGTGLAHSESTPTDVEKLPNDDWLEGDLGAL